MIRTWIAVALLAVSWLLGLHYYQPAHGLCWAIAVALGVLLFADRSQCLAARRDLGIAFFALLPAVWFWGWPYRITPVLIALGTAILWMQPPRRWPKPLAWAAVKAGTVLLVQSLVLQVYMTATARCHDLPWPLPSLVGWVATLAGCDAAVDGKYVVIHSIAQVHRLAATWDLLLDPATLLFFVGAVVALGLNASGHNGGKQRDTSNPPGKSGTGKERTRFRWPEALVRRFRQLESLFSPAYRRAVSTLALLIAAWLPVRVGLLMAIMLDRGLRADPTVPLTLMNQFFDARVHLLLLIGPVLLAWRFVRSDTNTGGWLGWSEGDPPDEKKGKGPTCRNGPKGASHNLAPSPSFRRYTFGLAAIGLAAAVAGFLFHWDPVGRAKGGRVMIVERHSTWEPTTRPYDTESYGEDPSYGYSGIYRYCGQFYRMSQLLEESAIDAATLARCDVLVVKTPTARYSRDEVTAIERFVEAGGGLLLVGEHTNFMNTSTYLNEIARPFGFKFRHDLLFCIGSPYVQWVVPATVPHPMVQHVPPMHYAVSCSIDPGTGIGRAVVRNTGLWSLPPDYNAENFFPQAEYRADMRYGAFIQLWATRHGRGRVAAFTDSTIFSNFSTFEPGKPELMLGMLQWLNHRSIWDIGWARLLLGGLLTVTAVGLAVGGTLTIGSRAGVWLPLLAVGTCGWTIGATAVLGLQHRQMQPLEAHTPMKRVVLDRTVSQVPLSRGGFTEDDGLGYGLVEQWIPRLGYYTRREAGPAAFSGDLLLIIAPTRSVSREYRRRLTQYVADGGKLLVFDSPDVATPTSGSLLWPFGMQVIHGASLQGQLHLKDGWPAIELGAACEVRGGEPFMWVGETPVAARFRFGKGTVMAIGFGSLMNDANMGYNWTAEPGQFERTVFDLLFMLIRSAVEDEPTVSPL